MSATQGRASFSMEFLKYAEVPNNIAEQLKTTENNRLINTLNLLTLGAFES